MQETRPGAARISMSAVAATLLACGGAALTAVAGSRAPDWLNRIAVALRASSGGW